MRISDAFPGAYLKAADLPDRPVTTTIGDCRMEDLGSEERRLVLNKPKAGALASARGDATTAWTGQRVELYVARVMFQGRMVDGILVRVPALQQPVPLPPDHTTSLSTQAPAPPGAPLDDDVPW